MTRNLRIAKSKLGAALLISGLLLADSAAYGAAPATAAGILHAPRAMVNGAQVERSAVLFKGDRIRTLSSVASLEFSGSAVLMAKDSSAVLEENQLALICGGALVKTLKSMSARAGNLVMKPAGDSARFELTRTEKSLNITALDGDLVVSNGKQETVVKAGRQMELSCTECMQESSFAVSASPGQD